MNVKIKDELKLSHLIGKVLLELKGRDMKKIHFIENLRSLLSNICRDGLDLHDYLYHGAEASIFRQDPNYNKIAKTADSKANYENTIYERMGYIDYYDTKELQEKASSLDKSVTTKPTKKIKLFTKNMWIV